MIARSQALIQQFIRKYTSLAVISTQGGKYERDYRIPAHQWVWPAYQIVRRELKIRYKNSALGFFWSFLNPLMQIIVMTIVFKYIVGSKIPNFSIELFTCLLPWMFFAQTLNDGAVCVAKDVMLVRKYDFPRIILPISTVVSNLAHLVLGFVVLLAIFIILPVHINRAFVWVIPLLLIQSSMILGFVLLISTLQMYYEDVRFMLGSFIQLLFFLCPMVYKIEDVMTSDRLTPLWRELYLVLNPLTPLFIGFRHSLLYGGVWPALPHSFYFYLAISTVWSFLILTVGVTVWRRHEWHFPEAV